MVSPADIELRKEAFSSKISRKGGDVGEGVDVSDCPCIQRAVVLDWSKGAILLFDEEKWGRVRRFRQTNVTFIQVFFDPFRKCVCFGRIERVDFTIQDRRGVRFEVDCVVIIPCGWKSLCFCFGKYLGMSSVFIWDRLKMFVLICFNRPFLGEVGSIDDYFVSFFPFARPC